MRFVAFWLALFCATAQAADVNSPVAQKAAEEMRAVLDANFQAISAENMDALMATTSRYSGTPAEVAEFKQEAQQMFKDTDVYLRLTNFQLVKFQPPRAYAIVQQLTLPADESDHTPRQGKLNFRHHSALLPEYQLVEYKQRFNFEDGKWKVHRVVTPPVPSGTWSSKFSAGGESASVQKQTGGESASLQKQNCPDGKCNAPFVRVRMK